jgi:hypothetical protein
MPRHSDADIYKELTKEIPRDTLGKLTLQIFNQYFFVYFWNYQFHTSTLPLPMIHVLMGSKTMSFVSMGNTPLCYSSTGNVGV